MSPSHASIAAPFYPIIYVRGYAMTPQEIASTAATPYMGFNLGATKIRQSWTGRVVRHIFESPLIRLMKDYGYQDIYHEGQEIDGPLSARSIVIHRYYEQADQQLGTGETPSIEEAAWGLHRLVLRLRDQVCGKDAAARKAFRVYLVAHSMGGLICRAFLQNPSIGTPESKALVDKVFTYATPHNGIDMLGVNVPRFVGLWDLDNFNRTRMRRYLALPDTAQRVDDLGGAFDPRRFFCLVGTNHRDYEVALGLSRMLAGEMSDGLVRIDNATVARAPRAYVHRSHSGPFGIVNSEEGYQNLVRFLFGDLRLEGRCEVEHLPLPPSVRRAKQAGKEIRASYYFEGTAAPRGAVSYTLTERRRATHSAILRTFDELLRPERAGREEPRWPHLFSLFLDTRQITRGRTVVLGLDCVIATTGYEIDGRFFFEQHLPGEVLFRDTVALRLTPTADGWRIRYTLADNGWSEGRGRPVELDEQGPFIPLRSGKGLRAKLRLSLRPWQ